MKSLVLAGVLLLLNAADAIFTMAVFGAGVEELNGLMGALLGWSLFGFFTTKLLSVGLLTAILVEFGDRPIARRGLAGLVVAYAAVVTWSASWYVWLKLEGLA